MMDDVPADDLAAAAAVARERMAVARLTRSESMVLDALLRLSLEAGRTLALVPTQTMLGVALGLHRTDVSRTLSALVRRGAVLRIQARGDTMYGVIPAGIEPAGRSAAAPDPEAAAGAWADLERMNRDRDRGVLADGQRLLPDLLPTTAGHADMERAVWVASQAPPRPPAAEPDLDDYDDVAARLAEALAASAPRRGESGTPPPGRCLDENPYWDPRLERVATTLTGDRAHQWQRLCREVARGTRQARQGFLDSLPNWQRWVRTWNLATLREAISDHQLRDPAADNPPAYIRAQMARPLQPAK